MLAVQRLSTQPKRCSERFLLLRKQKPNGAETRRQLGCCVDKLAVSLNCEGWSGPASAPLCSTPPLTFRLSQTHLLSVVSSLDASPPLPPASTRSLADPPPFSRGISSPKFTALLRVLPRSSYHPPPLPLGPRARTLALLTVVVPRFFSDLYLFTHVATLSLSDSLAFLLRSSVPCPSPCSPLFRNLVSSGPFSSCSRKKEDSLNGPLCGGGSENFGEGNSSGERGRQSKGERECGKLKGERSPGT